MSFIASPEIVTALALAGRLSFNPLTDTLIGADGKPFRLEPPAPAPEVPASGFARGDARLRRAAADGSSVDAARSNPAQRAAAALAPWPAWDGKDLAGMPILVKTRGKTTTDHISPAGPWLALSRPPRAVQRQLSSVRSTRSPGSRQDAPCLAE